MKNLRIKNPQLNEFRQRTRQAAGSWWDLNLDTRVNLCAQFIFLPVLEKNKTISLEMIDKVMPAAVDLERQASALLEEESSLFITIKDLLEQTAGLFLLSEGDASP